MSSHMKEDEKTGETHLFGFPFDAALSDDGLEAFKQVSSSLGLLKPSRCDLLGLHIMRYSVKDRLSVGNPSHEWG